MSRVRRMKRNDREEPDIPLPSACEVDNVIAAGGIGTEKRKDVEEGLARIRDQYMRHRRNLGFYATDKQLTDGLTLVMSRAALLRKALQECDAVRYALQTTLIPTFPGDNISEREHSEKICVGLDDDIAAVGRLHEVASTALQIQDNHRNQIPEFYAKPSAQKPEDLDLARDILRLWSDLGRPEKGRDATGLKDFAGRILEYVWQRSEVSPDTVADLLNRARAAKAASQSPG